MSDSHTERALEDYRAGLTYLDGLPRSYYALTPSQQVDFLKQASKKPKGDGRITASGLFVLLFAVAIVIIVIN
jgi:hypothetical protein